MEKTSNKLVDLSVSFAVEILNLVKFLKSQHETIISNQIGRAGTSIGANIHEAQYAHGKQDFIAKLQIALKEANETCYWLLLLSKTNYIVPAEYDRLESLCREGTGNIRKRTGHTDPSAPYQLNEPNSCRYCFGER